MNDELTTQWLALIDEESRHLGKASAMLMAIQLGRGLVVDRKLRQIADRELLQAEFAYMLQMSPIYQADGEED